MNSQRKNENIQRFIGQIILLALLLSVAASASAVEAEIGGLWYELISKAKEASVIQYKNGVKYSGDIDLPLAPILAFARENGSSVVPALNAVIGRAIHQRMLNTITETLLRFMPDGMMEEQIVKYGIKL